MHICCTLPTHSGVTNRRMSSVGDIQYFHHRRRSFKSSSESEHIEQQRSAQDGTHAGAFRQQLEINDADAATNIQQRVSSDEMVGDPVQ